MLHAHLPFVRHPEYEFFLEEDWLYEAITETYIPLIQMMTSLVADGVPFRLTLSMSPTLVSMLEDPLLQERYRRRLCSLNELAHGEVDRTRGDKALNRLARHYQRRFNTVTETWQRHQGNLVQALDAFQRQGSLEIMTCAATHGFLPLMQGRPEAVRAQVRVGVEHHALRFHRPPQGIWLPECGYFPGLDSLLAQCGLRFFVGDAHSLLLARPRPRRGCLDPVFCAGSGVAVFPRDVESARQVWCRESGYPGDPLYREFYRDIGFDLDQDTIGPFVQPDGARKNTGIKYHRITGPTDHKDLYDPAAARARADQHAVDFLASRRRQMEGALQEAGRLPLVVCPYDAELFGHWWYEGPRWLEQVLRRADQEGMALTHLSQYLTYNPTHQVCTPAASSWGDGGFNQFWLDPSSEWIYPHLHVAAGRMAALARDIPGATGARRRALNQAARELLLAQASDWAFILRSGTMVDYARQRTDSHLRRFFHLHDIIRAGRIDLAWLARIEYLDNIFPELDYTVYSD